MPLRACFLKVFANASHFHILLLAAEGVGAEVSGGVLLMPFDSAQGPNQIFTEWQILEVLGGIAVDIGNKTATSEACAERSRSMVGVVEKYLVFAYLGCRLQYFERLEAGFTRVECVVVDAEALKIAVEAFGHGGT